MSNNSFKKALLLSASCLLLAGVANAATTWTNAAGSTGFYTAGNWTNGLPGTSQGVAFTQDAIIDGSVTTAIAGGGGAGSVNVGDLTLTIINGGKMQIGSSSYYLGGTGAGSALVTGTDSYLGWFGGTAIGTGRLGNSGTIALTVENGGLVAATTMAFANASTINVNDGGTLHLSSTAATIMSGSGAINLSAGGNFQTEKYVIGGDNSYLSSFLYVNGKAWSTAVEGVDYTVSGATITAMAIPEPSTYALAGGLTALGLAAILRRRRKTA